jgi:crossover junction endodeoxyribonuclease RuvC
MKILGIDPGLRLTGYGIIERHGTRLTYIASGTIRIPPGGELPGRLRHILDGMAEVIATYRPEIAVIEKVFVNANPQSTLLLGQARGAAICALVLANLPVSEYTALQIKQAVAGHGKAQKSAVQEMVRRLLKRSGSPSPDSADALAAAICHTSHIAMTTAAGGQLARLGLKVRGGRLVG